LGPDTKRIMPLTKTENFRDTGVSRKERRENEWCRASLTLMKAR
jgi:hypothetical protein